MVSIYYDKRYFAKMSPTEIYQFFRLLVVAKGIEIEMYGDPHCLEYIGLNGIKCEDCVVSLN